MSIPSNYGLESHGLKPAQAVHWNLSSTELVEYIVRRGEGRLTQDGPIVVVTTPHTGRSPNDKYVVREPSSEQEIWWAKNGELSEAQFDGLHRKTLQYLSEREVFVRDLYACADRENRLRVRLIDEMAWTNLFANNLFIRPPAADLPHFQPDFTILHAPELKADPATDKTRTETAIAINFAKKIILIVGTRYAGEIKKSIFTILNYLLPKRGVLSMHCSANIGSKDDAALFFGLSGTGKTTLSADPKRSLIGDDEHGWGHHGVFNFEGGCYAKVIKLSATAEPEIYATTKRFGTVLENVVIDPATRALLLDLDTITENTRAAYPVDFISNAVIPGVGGHPKNVMFLTADAFGVLPPISKLTPEQAMYHFLSGYTARLAGTERGVTEPQATFSTCFGAPFLPLHPTVYARLLGENLAKHRTQVWLVNTGWSGGPAGIGQRMKIAYTRATVHAALNGELDEAPTEVDPIFGLPMPIACPGVPQEVLNPRNTWADQDAYDRKARELAALFVKNFEQFLSIQDTFDLKAILAAGPKV